MKRSREDVNNGSYIISFGVAWDKLVFAKQTIFPVYDVQSTLDTPLSPPTSPGSPELAELLNARNSRPPELKAQRGVSCSIIMILICDSVLMFTLPTLIVTIRFRLQVWNSRYVPQRESI